MVQIENFKIRCNYELPRYTLKNCFLIHLMKHGFYPTVTGLPNRVQGVSECSQ